jgi:hypothetical protein
VSITAFDLTALAKVLTPAWSPMGSCKRPPPVQLDLAPEGMVWVRIWRDYRDDDGSHEAAWEQWCSPDVPEHTRQDLRLVPARELMRWERARRQYAKAQAAAERWAERKPAP